MTYTIELEIVADDEDDAMNRAAALLDIPVSNLFEHCEITENENPNVTINDDCALLD